MSDEGVHSRDAEARKTRGMRFGFASLLLWMVWLLTINILSRFGGRVWVGVTLLTVFPFVCGACVVLAIIAAFRHSKWWSLSALMAAFLCYEFLFGIRVAAI